MDLQRHVIKRQVIKFTLAKQEQARPVQQALSRIFRQHFPGILDRYLSEASQPDALHRINRLELDLGELDSRHLEADILERIGPALQRALYAHTGNPQSKHDAQFRAHLELIEQFVREGNLPWWADNSQRQAPELSLTALLTSQPKSLRQLLIKLMQEPRCLLRIISYFDDDHLTALLGLLSAATKASATSLLQTLWAIETPLRQSAAKPTPVIRLTLWQSLLQVAAAGEPAISNEVVFLNAVIVRWGRLLGINPQVIDGCFQQILSQTEATKDNPWLEAMRAKYPKQQSPRKPAKKPSASVEDNETSSENQITENAGASLTSGVIQPNTVTAIHQTEKNQPSLAAADDLAHDIKADEFNQTDALYIDNAGLCLLWPYLQSFFASLELVQNDRFINPAAQQCAVSLLHYVATGDKEPPEYMLPFNKLLCGMAIEAVFEIETPLTNQQLSAADAFLAAVIANAPVLNDMSLNGFRGSYLLRQGSLSADVGCWLLRVERMTYDIALEHFPWTWQWFKLPWMEYPVRVEW